LTRSNHQIRGTHFQTLSKQCETGNEQNAIHAKQRHPCQAFNPEKSATGENFKIKSLRFPDATAGRRFSKNAIF
jgi:hypothetical protein